MKNIITLMSTVLFTLSLATTTYAQSNDISQKSQFEGKVENAKQQVQTVKDGQVQQGNSTEVDKLR